MKVVKMLCSPRYLQRLEFENWRKTVADMIKQFREIDKFPMPGKIFVTPINTETLSFYYKSKALEAVNLIKEKICGKIKGRTCTDGGKKKIHLK